MVNGRILRQKSEQLAQQMGYDDFSATKGWFCCWKVWSGWVKYRVESRKADGKAANAWTENNVTELIKTTFTTLRRRNFCALPDLTMLKRARSNLQERKSS